MEDEVNGPMTHCIAWHGMASCISEAANNVHHADVRDIDDASHSLMIHNRWQTTFTLSGKREEAIDCNGVTKELFAVVSETLFAPDDKDIAGAGAGAGSGDGGGVGGGRGTAGNCSRSGNSGPKLFVSKGQGGLHPNFEAVSAAALKDFELAGKFIAKCLIDTAYKQDGHLCGAHFSRALYVTPPPNPLHFFVNSSTLMDSVTDSAAPHQ